MYLDNIYVPSLIIDPVQNVKEYFLSIPYFGDQSEKLRDKLLVLITKYFFPILNLKLYLKIIFVLVAYFITKMCFLPLCDRLSFIRFVVHTAYIYMSVQLFVFFTRDSQSIVVGAPVRVLA